MEDLQLQLNGKPVWLIKSSDQCNDNESCNSCVFGPLKNNCPRDYNREGLLHCTVDEDTMMHFTDVDPAANQAVPSSVNTSALNVQVGGEHYKDMKIQPVEYIHANNLSFLEGNVVKYITRHKTKNKAQDIRKIIHYCTLILQLEYNETYEQESK